MKNSSGKVAYIGLLTALAMILSYVELLIPPVFIGFPGVKLGLPNVIIIYILYKIGFKAAFCVSIIRVVTVGMLFGNAVTLAYSLSGAIISILIMYFMKKANLFSCVGVSVCGSVLHNLAQIFVAMLLVKTVLIGYYMILLLFSGTIFGIIIGVLSSLLIKRF